MAEITPTPQNTEEPSESKNIINSIILADLDQLVDNKVPILKTSTATEGISLSEYSIILKEIVDKVNPNNRIHLLRTISSLLRVYIKGISKVESNLIYPDTLTLNSYELIENRQLLSIDDEKVTILSLVKFLLWWSNEIRSLSGDDKMVLRVFKLIQPIYDYVDKLQPVK